MRRKKRNEEIRRERELQEDIERRQKEVERRLSRLRVLAVQAKVMTHDARSL